MKTYKRDPSPQPDWHEDVCAENNPHIRIGKRDLHAECGRLHHAAKARSEAAGSAVFPTGQELTTEFNKRPAEPCVAGAGAGRRNVMGYRGWVAMLTLAAGLCMLTAPARGVR